MTEEKKGPVKKFKNYPIEVAVWKFLDKESGYPRYSATTQKVIKDKDTGKYKTIPWLNAAEAALTAALLYAAVDWMSDQQPEKTEEKSETEPF